MFLSEEEIEKRVRDSYELKNDVLKMTSKPLVSIRTSTYNHGPYIKQCIEGVLMQKTNFPFEYIIGEDFSTDETREIVFEYARKFPNVIRVITADYNVGSKANGRRCINACRGKYMAICEGDDYWVDPLKLQKQVDFLEKNPEYSMCFHNALVHWENNKFPDVTFACLEDRDYTGEEIYCNWIVPTASVVFRKECLGGVYKERVKNPSILYGDIILFLSLIEKGKVHAFPEIMSVYRRHEGGAVYGVNIQRIIKKIDHDRFIGNDFNGRYRKYSKRIRNLSCIYLFSYYLLRFRIFHALYYILYALYLDFFYSFYSFYKLFRSRS